MSIQSRGSTTNYGQVSSVIFIVSIILAATLFGISEFSKSTEISKKQNHLAANMSYYLFSSSVLLGQSYKLYFYRY